ncbi:MAG: tripartite tricarboxylate transporter TctB family protein [Burkholderiales bacterium]|nr:tripartite tricarboxylate transporter TctB family protein [Burkholderiales bacterium]
MKIKNYQDLYAGLMFLIFGALAAWLSTSYNMGTGARMGPGYFPFWLGIILAALGVLIIVKAIGVSDGKEHPVSLKPLVVFVAMFVFSLGAGWLGASPNASLAIGTIVGCVFSFFIGMRAMGLILGSVTVFGLMLKGLGLVLCVTILVIIASLASHEMKKKEVIASIVVLSAMAVGIFVYGLKLQMPVWPDTQELGRMFVPAEKKK